MVYQGAVIVVNQYFDKRLGRANGFAYGGVGVGIMIASPIMTLLIEDYTWRGAQLIMAGFFANCCVVATIFRPLSWWSQNGIVTTPESVPLETNLNSESREGREDEGTNRTRLINEREAEDAKFVSPAPDMPDDTDSIRPEFLPQETVSEQFVCRSNQQIDKESNKCVGYCAKQCGVLKKLVNLFGVSLLWTNSNVLLLCIMAFFNGGGYFPSYVYLASYAKAAGSSELKASFIFTIIGICSMTARFLHGFLIDYKIINVVRLYAIASVLSAVSCFIIVFSSSYPSFMAFGVIFGVSTGTLVPLSPVITKTYTEKKELASAFALQCLFLGLGQFAGVYLQGKITM